MVGYTAGESRPLLEVNSVASGGYDVSVSNSQRTAV
jgi:hypothetical protein